MATNTDLASLLLAVLGSEGLVDPELADDLMAPRGITESAADFQARRAALVDITSELAPLAVPDSATAVLAA